jgi:hypothetical protein
MTRKDRELVVVDEAKIGSKNFCSWPTKGRNMVGCLPISSANAERTVSRRGDSFAGLVDSDVFFAFMRLREAVMKPGRFGVVISRTNVGYWYVRWKMRVNVMMDNFLVEDGSDF